MARPAASAPAQVLTDAQRAVIAEPLAAAFGSTFWFAMVLTMVAVVPALLLPMHPPAPPAAQPSGEPPADQREPVLVGID